MLNSQRFETGSPMATRMAIGRMLEAMLETSIAHLVKVQLIGILAKLDADAGVTDTNYTSLWKPLSAGGALAAFQGMLAKLDADAGVGNATGTMLARYGATAPTLGLKFRAFLVGLDAFAVTRGTGDTNYTALWDEPLIAATAGFGALCPLDAVSPI